MTVARKTIRGRLTTLTEAQLQAGARVTLSAVEVLDDGTTRDIGRVSDLAGHTLMVADDTRSLTKEDGSYTFENVPVTDSTDTSPTGFALQLTIVSAGEVLEQVVFLLPESDPDEQWVDELAALGDSPLTPTYPQLVNQAVEALAAIPATITTTLTDDASAATTVIVGRINAAINALVNGAPGALNTLKEIADQLAADEGAASSVAAALTTHAGRTDNPHATTKAQVGLSNVDNTSDLAKPVSTAQAAAIATAISNLVAGAPGALDTLNELATQLTSDETAAGALTTLVSGIRNLTDPTHVTGLNNAFARRWAANTAYTAGDTVLAPDGSLVKAKANFTSGSVYSSANWTSVATTADTQEAIELAALIAAGVGTADRTQSRISRLRTILGPGAYGTWYVQQVSSLKHRLVRHVGDGFYFSHDLSVITPQGGSDTCHQIQDVTYGIAMANIDQEAGSGVTRSGTGWAAATTDANAFGGSYRSSNATTATVTYTIPIGATAIGHRGVQSSNGGVARVSIDGDYTAATSLPTAQQLVTAGSIPSTALVANGGPFNPTDRAYLEYVSGSTVSDNPVLFVSGLSPSASTRSVVLAATAVVPTGSGNTRLYDSGISYSTGVETPLTTGAVIMPVYTVQTGRSAWESVHSYVPSGGGTAQFIGSIHGYEAESTFTLAVDGADPGLTDGTGVVVKGYAQFIKKSVIHHPDAGAGKVADVVTAYRLDRDGLTTTRTWTWRLAGTIDAGYAAMMPLNGYVMDKAGFPDAATEYTLTAADDSQKGKTAVPAAYAWDEDGVVAAMMELLDPEVGVNNWAKSSNQFMWVQDRSVSGGLKYNKVYASRVSPVSGTVAVAAGDVWTSSARYQLARIPVGATVPLPVV